jgi:hypothetical protein
MSLLVGGRPHALDPALEEQVVEGRETEAPRRVGVGTGP